MDQQKGAIFAIYNRALRQDPTLQGKFVMARPTHPIGQRAINAPPPPPFIAVAITPGNGETIKGTLVRINDSYVTLRDSSGVTRTFARNGDDPKVELYDPLEAHIDMLGKYTDKNIHDLTAYLASLK